jgi:Reverse transcriptase (RNA-dependent DNA polymerase)
MLEQFLSDIKNVKEVCLTEHFLKEGNYSKSKIGDYNFASIFCRKENKCGGSAILVHETLSFTERGDVSNLSIEGILECSAVDITLENNTFSIVSVYRPPSILKQDVNQFIDRFEVILNKLNSEKKYPIICGDFNLNLLDNDSNVYKFKDILNVVNLVPTIHTPTRFCDTTATLIDNIFISKLFPLKYCDNQVLDFYLSDHEAQILKICDSESISSKIKTSKRNFSVKNIKKFKNCLKNETWLTVYKCKNTNESFNEFHKIMRKHFEESFPNIEFKNVNFCNKDKKRNDFMTLGLRVSQKKVRIIKKLQKMYPNIWSKEYAKTYKYIYYKLVRLSSKKLNTYKIKTAANKSQAMWQIINEKHGKNKVKEYIKSLVVNGEENFNAKVMSNAFGDHYVNCITDIKNHMPKCDKPYDTEKLPVNVNSMFLSPVTPYEIYKLIKSLKNKKSSGFDEISDFLIKQCAEYVNHVLSYIINQSFNEGVFPEILKLAIIKPLHKKGSKTDLNNYRPVNLLSVFSKIFEKAFLIRLLSFLKEFKILADFQHGFQKSKSTETAIFELIDSFLKSIDEKSKTAGIFLDLSKAFDMVDHEILLSKLNTYGIRGTCYKWLQSFLKNRKQKVQLTVLENGNEKVYTSEEKTINFSVIQGSILGPILFLIYINDLPLNITDNAHPVGYADDSNFKISGINNIVLHENSVKLIVKVKNFLNTNGLKLNVQKTEIIQFQNIHNKNVRLDSIQIDDESILLAKNTKFLGIIIDESLKWNDHIDFICKKLSSVIFAINELRQESEIECLLTMYYANFHCHLKYAVICWGNAHDAIRVFRLQKKVIRLICSAKKRDSCRDLFKILGILTLTCVFIMECALKVKQNMSKFTEHVIHHQHATRNQSGKIPPIYCRTEMYKNGPFHSCLNIYNNLPPYLREIDNYNIFKTSLKIFLLNNQFYDLKEYYNQT